MFADRAQPATEALQALVADMESEARALLSYYGEDPSSTKVEELLSTVTSFAASLQVKLNQWKNYIPC